MNATNCYLCDIDDCHIIFQGAISSDGLLPEHIAARQGGINKLISYKWVRCNRCGLVYANPAPEPHLLANLYKDSDQGGYNDEISNLTYTYGRYLRSNVSLLGDMGNALEVGAGNGFFLIELRKMGYHHVIGVEPSVAACALAPDEIRSSLRNTTFTEQDFLPESFDLITCFQTLEHIPAPQHLIESFSKLLRRDGIVYAVSHDFSALGVKLLGHRHPIVNAGHLTLFDKQTLRKIFSKHFHVVSVFPIRNRYSLGYWVKLLPIPETVRKGMLSILDKTSLSSVPITMSLGNIGIIAKKR